LGQLDLADQAIVGARRHPTTGTDDGRLVFELRRLRSAGGLLVPGLPSRNRA